MVLTLRLFILNKTKIEKSKKSYFSIYRNEELVIIQSKSLQSVKIKSEYYGKLFLFWDLQER